jgi:hypothetical protein
MPEKKYEDAALVTGAGVVGAGAGQGVYQGAGYAGKHIERKVTNPKIYKDPKNRRGFTKTEYKKKIEGAKDKYGKRVEGKVTDWKSVYRNFPKDVPGGRLVRTLSHTHGGRTGVAVGTAATVTGGAGAMYATKKKVEKSMDPHTADPFGIHEISKVSAKLKLIAGAKRGLFDAAGVTSPKMREAAYAGKGPVKSKLYNAARSKTRKEMEPRLIALREHPQVKRAAFRIVREEAGKKVQAAKPYMLGAGAGGAAAGAVAYSQKDEVQGAVRETAKKAKHQIHKRGLSQEQIDRRKRVQAASSKTTATLGLAALGAQGTSALVSRGKIKKLPHLNGGKLAMRTVTEPAKEAENLKSKVTPLLATSAGVGAISGFNFASYTKAEAKQHKKNIPAQ